MTGIGCPSGGMSESGALMGDTPAGEIIDEGDILSWVLVSARIRSSMIRRRGSIT